MTPSPSARACSSVARRWTVTGQVQGVGFRPFVYRLAHHLRLTGWVRNRLGEVEIHAEGPATLLDQFADALISSAPSIARPRIASTESVNADGHAGFEIRPSLSTEHPRIHLPPDYFACPECLAEVEHPADRRYGYPFTNCTQCGPRYTLIERLPYDRANTSMAGFALCDDCRREYEDPLNRRFHAEPVACPRCGPQLEYVTRETKITDSASALAHAVAALQAGRVLAVKGVGGYHLICDACNAVAVAALRARKPRPAKPLAVMFPEGTDQDSLARCVTLTDAERTLLSSPMRPIVLARKIHDGPLADGIAPQLNEIGVLLPYSPLHHLLSRAFAGPLVVTSGNLSGEPVLTDNDEATQRLAPVADGFLHHNRPIVRPADDPVYRTLGGKPRPLRLGRGGAPLELPLPRRLAAPLLAVGGHLKLTVCLAWEDRAVVSPHIGDMGTPRSLSVFTQVVEDLQRLYGVRAARLICDAHPGYATTRWATAQHLPHTAIWHHYAHAGALAGEYGADNDWLVFTWDGTGLGADGTLWGGEALHGKPGRWRRVASWRPFRLPGGDKAGRAPWRSAAALSWESGHPFALPDTDLALLQQAWHKGLNAPATSAVGRLFDAAASLTGILQEASFEGQGPMYLEAAARDTGTALELPLARDAEGVLRTDWAPLVPMLADNSVPLADRALCFHLSLARALRRQAERIAGEFPVTTIGLTGGVFQNARLAAASVSELEAAGFKVMMPEQLPCNDAGIAYGQVIETLYRKDS